MEKLDSPFPASWVKSKGFFIQRMDFAFFFKFLFHLHRDMQVIPSIVLLLFKKKNHSLELVKIEECPEKKRSQSIARGKERLLIGLAKRPCI